MAWYRDSFTLYIYIYIYSLLYHNALYTNIYKLNYMQCIVTVSTFRMHDTKIESLNKT
jgi:hypothetical protein